jgi:hypothetical protein
MKKTIYACDVNSCKFVTEDVSEIKKSRILDKEYDMCPDCRKSLDDFVEKRLAAGGHSPGTSELEQVIEAMKGLSTPSPIGGGITISPYDPPVYGQNPAIWKVDPTTTTWTLDGNVTTTIPVETSGIEKIDPSKPTVTFTGAVMQAGVPTANGTIYTEAAIKNALGIDQYFTDTHQPDPLS